MTQFYKILVLLGFSLIAPFGFGQDLFSHENSLKYCNHLLETSQFEALLIEQLRIHNLGGDLDSLNKEIYKTYLKLADYRNLSSFVNDNKASFDTKEKLDAWVLSMELDSLKNFINANPKNSLSAKYSLILAMLNGDSKKAKLIYYELEDSITVQQLAIAMATVKTKPKKVYIACILSALVPGLGKIYLRKNRDGLTAFTATSIFVWQSVVGFNKKGLKSSYGIINGMFGLGFYLGNIYGTVKEARLQNHERKKLIHNLVINNCIIQ